MTSKEFIQMFCGDASVDKKFCFILGSGASKSSGINTGAELAEKWLAEIPTFVDKPIFELWCEEEKIDKNDPGPHYSKIFEKRYNDRKDGDAFLDGVMQKAWPSYGYFVLAKILSEMRHNIVITPNFDSLCEDALFFYTQKKPLVIGHQSLGNYINVSPSRPTIIKVHNDVLLSPKNSRIDLQRISQEYEMKLKDIFKLYIPVVIGYGGNDESLMSFLENISHIESQMYWCYLDSDKVGVRVNNLICRNIKIETVPIQGFDQLMIQIANRFQHNRIDNDLFRIAQKWVKLSRDQIIKIVQDKPDDINTKEALLGINKRGDEDLFYYLLNGSVVTDKRPTTSRSVKYQFIQA